MSSTLSKFLRPYVEATIRARGESYFLERRITPLKSSESGEMVFAVRGTEDYRVVITINEVVKSVEVLCSCPFFDKGAPCKHIWASALAAESLKLFIGDIDEEWEMVEDYLEDDYDDDYDDDDEQDEYDGQDDNSDQVSISWQQKLENAKNAIAQSDKLKLFYPPTKSNPINRVAHYALDLNKSLANRRLTVRFFIQEFRKNGTLGAIKGAELSHEMIESFEDPKDKALLWDLLGRTDAIETYYSSSRGKALVRLAFPFADDLLRRMSETGRLHLLTNSSRYSVSKAEKLNPESFSFSKEMWKLKLASKELPEALEISAHLASETANREIKEALGGVGPYVFFNDCIAKSNLDKGAVWFELMRQEGHLKITNHQIDDFLEFYFASADAPELELPSTMHFKTLEGIKPKGCLSIYSEPALTSYRVERHFDYAGRLVAESDSRTQIVDYAEKSVFMRDHKGEAELQATLPSIHDRLSTAEFLGYVERALASGWDVRAHGKPVRIGGEFKIDVVSGVDWFDVRADIDFDGNLVGLPALIAALKNGQRMIPLGDGTLGLLPEQWQTRFGVLAELGKAGDTSVRLNKIQTLLWQASLPTGGHLEGDRKFQVLSTMLKDLKSLDPSPPPLSFQGQLRTYQKQGLAWLEHLVRHKIGGILADDMGLGKTVQVLALLQVCKSSQKRDKRKPTLIVAPKSLVFNWMKEAERFTPTLKVINLTGVGRQKRFSEINQHDIALTTYQSLRMDIDQLNRLEFDLFILDEAHFVKNPTAHASIACRLIKAETKFCLTGTPVENSLKDLFSLLTIVNPGLVSENQAKRWADRPDEDLLTNLNRALRPFLLRRTKDEVLKDLPSKTENVIYCELSSEEKRKYAELKAFYWKKLTGKFKEKGLASSKIEVLEALLRLRQAACHQGLLDPKLPSEQPSSKFEVLLDQLTTVIADGHRALVFSQFTSLLALLKPHLRNREIDFEYLDGKSKDRQAIVDRFQQQKVAKVFLLSLKAGGVGLNLTEADYVYILDPWWNPAVEAQAVDRAHRIGQTRSVFAYRLIARDTVEEKILELQKSKRELAKAVMSGEASLMKSLQLEDLKVLFS